MPYILTHKEYEKSRIYKLWDACEREFGPIFRLDMPGQAPSVFISEPGDIEHVLKSTAKNQQRDLFSSLKYVRDTHDFFKKDKSGIMSEQGDEWWRVRRRVQPYTAKPKHVELYLPVCQDFAFGPPDVPIRFHSFVQSSVAESEAALETRSPDAEGDGLTLVEMLLLDPELSREDAHAYLMDLLTAGIDAVAIKAAFVLTLLAQHPEEQQKVHEELDAVLGDGTQPLTPQHLAKLRYTKACVKEVLRISSPSTLTSRQLVEDTVICGYLVPKGQPRLLEPQYAVGYWPFFPPYPRYVMDKYFHGLSRYPQQAVGGGGGTVPGISKAHYVSIRFEPSMKLASPRLVLGFSNNASSTWAHDDVPEASDASTLLRPMPSFLYCKATLPHYEN
ncbi:hypothetical protein C7M84_009822 [Penaeus vannamei]|uniref:Cytochrome P450 n=1 Tax=Penaeus vannamei TaxID=6689 RepID=A0A423T5Z8_PENVA|nr:hypothetical protein C7M84_009822 [Penaeus vannamei]